MNGEQEAVTPLFTEQEVSTTPLGVVWADSLNTLVGVNDTHSETGVDSDKPDATKSSYESPAVIPLPVMT